MLLFVKTVLFVGLTVIVFLLREAVGVIFLDTVGDKGVEDFGVGGFLFREDEEA